MGNQRNTVFVRFLLNFVTVYLVKYPALAQTQNCAGSGPCRCVMSDGTGTVDISSIGNFSGQARFPNSPSYDGVPFAYNPCFSISLDDCQSAAVCKKVSGKFTGQGTQNSAQWSFRGQYPVITYSSPNTKTEVMLICERTFINPQLTVIGELPGGTVGMMLSTKCACPGACPDVAPPSGSSAGLSLGSVLLIVFFALLGAYLVFGATFNCSIGGKSGKEVLPNYESWTLLPGLILGGFRFTSTVVCSRKEQKYESI